MKPDRRLIAGLTEAVLLCVTDRQHATTIAGDLTEMHQGPGVPLVRDVATTAVRLGFDSLRSAPVRNVLWLLQALALWIICNLAARAGLALTGWLPSAATAGCAACAVAEALLLAGSVLLGSLAAGCMLGTMHRRTSTNPALPLALVFTCLAPALLVSDLAAGTLTWLCVATYLFVIPLCYVVPLLAGPALTRSRMRFG